MTADQAIVPLLDSEFAVIRTVCYSSVFDFPLTLDELRKTLIEFKSDNHALMDLFNSSAALQRVIEFEDGYFFLRGKRHLVKLRENRRQSSIRILRKNRGILKLICALPYTRLVALSGSASHLNLDEDGDLDLFVVTRGRRVWSVAFTILLLTKALGKRKLICFNYLTADERLEVEGADLFSANQIASLKTLVGESTGMKFLKHNTFVSHVYPGFEGLEGTPVECAPGSLLSGIKSVLEVLFLPGISQLVEIICRGLYRRRLLGQADTWATPEEVTLEKDLLKLHTQGHRKQVYLKYNAVLKRALSELGVTLDAPAERVSLINGTKPLKLNPPLSDGQD